MPINPTRMELNRLKKRLKTAVRGHKLLKDKRDEMVRRFVVLVRKNKELREAVEADLAEAMSGFVLSRAVMSLPAFEEALLLPSRQTSIKVSTRNIMSVDVPEIELEESEVNSSLPYGFVSTSADLDQAVLKLTDLLPKLVELAAVEKSCQRLADEIEKIRRRVNALEYVMIPEMEANIRMITMKLDENERGNLTRLMKMKDMLAKQAQ